MTGRGHDVDMTWTGYPAVIVEVAVALCLGLVIATDMIWLVTVFCWHCIVLGQATNTFARFCMAVACPCGHMPQTRQAPGDATHPKAPGDVVTARRAAAAFAAGRASARRNPPHGHVTHGASTAAAPWRPEEFRASDLVVSMRQALARNEVPCMTVSDVNSNDNVGTVVLTCDGFRHLIHVNIRALAEGLITSERVGVDEAPITAGSRRMVTRHGHSLGLVTALGTTRETRGEHEARLRRSDRSRTPHARPTHASHHIAPRRVFPPVPRFEDNAEQGESDMADNTDMAARVDDW